jgi:Zn-dependent M28 family amino/carboxypeptidase
MKKLILFAAAATLFAGSALAADGPISAQRLKADDKVLSSDAFEGRGVGGPGEQKTIAFIKKQFEAAGLKPGGDKTSSGRAWTQAVPLTRFQMSGPVTAEFTAGGKTERLTQGEQIAIRPAQNGETHVSIKAAPVVFVGYGVNAPERHWNDYKGLDLHGKVALVLVNDPDFETAPNSKDGGDFGGRAMTYYGRWTYKYEEAARRGALAMIVIHETAPASYGWNVVKNSNTGAIFDITREDPAKAHVPVEAWIQHDPTVALFREAGLDYAALKKQAQTRDFRPVVLKGVTFSADFAVNKQHVVSHNVVGVLPGKTHPNERVIYSAHWDHLGIGAPDKSGDRIYNGAVDNGTGTAALIELGRAFAEAPRTDRTVQFLSVTAEEQGLLGSEYYATHPLYPLATTVADINMDALSPTGPTRDITTSGEGGLTLQDDLIKVAKAHGRYFTPDPNPGAGHFFRSDHFSFAKQGVPALSFGSGEDLVNGGKAAGKAAAETYTREHYHQPSDEFDPNWDLTGMAQDIDILYDLGRKLANSREWPSWYQGSEFRAAREKTAAQRK